jgi:hypothetical protein
VERLAAGPMMIDDDDDPTDGDPPPSSTAPTSSSRRPIHAAIDERDHPPGINQSIDRSIDHHRQD